MTMNGKALSPGSRLLIRVQTLLFFVFSSVLVVAGSLSVVSSSSLDFHNVATPAGLLHTFPNGGIDSKTYILETTGSGVAFFDYNNDSWVDIFLVSGPARIPPTP